jgi:hypothetical protein
MACHLDTTCTSVTCCAPVDLINRNINFFLKIDPCNYTFSLGIEKYNFEFSLYETDFNATGAQQVTEVHVVSR